MIFFYDVTSFLQLRSNFCVCVLRLLGEKCSDILDSHRLCVLAVFQFLQEMCNRNKYPYINFFIFNSSQCHIRVEEMNIPGPALPPAHRHKLYYGSEQVFANTYSLYSEYLAICNQCINAEQGRREGLQVRQDTIPPITELIRMTGPQTVSSQTNDFSICHFCLQRNCHCKLKKYIYYLYLKSFQIKSFK